MKITFSEHQFDVRKNDDNLYSLKDIENGWKESGGKGKTLRHWKDSPEIKELSKLSDFRVVNIEGRFGGTWGNKEAVIEYAAHCSVKFRIAVLTAFKELSEGNSTQAAITSGSVIITDELIQKVKRTREQMNAMLKVHIWNIKSFHYGNFMKLVCKAATGYVPSVLTGKHGTSIDYIIESGNGEAMQALLASMETVIAMLTVGVDDYQKIATVLHVETSKNKKQLSQMKLVA